MEKSDLSRQVHVEHSDAEAIDVFQSVSAQDPREAGGFLLRAALAARSVVPKRARQRIKSVLAYPYTLRLVCDYDSFRTLRRLENSTTDWPKPIRPVELRLKPLGGRPLAVRPRTSDRYVLRDTFVGKAHLPPLSMPDPRLILDLGAHIGSTAAHLAARYPRARIVAVEVDPDNAALCRRNLAVFGSRCVVEQAAVVAHDGPVTYASGGGDAVRSKVVDAAGAVTRGVSLKTVLESHMKQGQLVDYVKVDVEGSERELLRSNTDWVERVRTMRIEVHPPYTVEECLADLRRLGFEARLFAPARGSGMPAVEAIRAEGAR